MFSTGNQTTRKRSFKATMSLARMTTNNLNKVALIFRWVRCGHMVGQDNGEKRSLSDGERSLSVLESLRGLSLFELKWGGSVCSLFLKWDGSCQGGSVCLFFLSGGM